MRWLPLSVLLAGCAPAASFVTDAGRDAREPGAMDAAGDAETADVVSGEAAPADERAESAADVRSDAPSRICVANSDCSDSDPCTMMERCDLSVHACRSVPLDSDGDGFPPLVCGGTDCDDSDARVHPIQYPHCGLSIPDSNCNGIVDTNESPSQILARCASESLRFAPREEPGSGRWMPECVSVGPNRGCRVCNTARCICWQSGNPSSVACDRR